MIGYDDAGGLLTASSVDGAIEVLLPESEEVDFIAPSADFLVRAVTHCWEEGLLVLAADGAVDLLLPEHSFGLASLLPK